MSQLVEMGIKFWIRFLAVGFARNDRVHSSRLDLLSDRFGVVILVRDDVFRCGDFAEDFARNLRVVNLTPSDFKIDRISMRIGGNMELGSKPATRLSETFRDFPIALFFPVRAPLACW